MTKLDLRIRHKTALLDEAKEKTWCIQSGDLLWLRSEEYPWLILVAKQQLGMSPRSWAVSFLLDETELGMYLDGNDLKNALIHRQGKTYRFMQ